MRFGGNNKSFHSAEFRFIVYSCNTCTSKLKPKPTELKSIRYSFNRNKKMVTGCGFSLN